MMNTTTYNPSGMHQEHNVVVTHAHQHTHSHPAPGLTSVGYLHQPAPLQLHSTPPLTADHPHPQQLATALATTADGSTHSTANAAALFDPRRLQLTAPLDKSYYTTAAAASVTAPASGARFFTTSAAASSAPTPSTTVEHQHQHGNTILITNNFASQQQFTAAGQAHTQPNTTAAQLQQQPNAAIAGIPPVTTATGSYNGNGSNIRIITTLPSSLQPNVMSQQHIYNIVKDEDQHQPGDILQLHQSPYYQPQPAATHFPQHLPTSLLPQHFTQQHFAATQPPAQPQTHTAATHLQLPAAPQQFFMPLTDTSGGPLAAAAANPVATTKLLTTLPTLAGNVSVTSSAAVNADATTSTTTMTPAAANSTVVLDRINICINNHYSDSMASSSTTMDSTTTNSHALTNVSHTQQPSPIIPAIHHKVVVDTSCNSSGASGSVGGGGGISSALHIDPYASNDSTLVIDEPDSTTTTPHTPPTTPENSSPPPPSLSALTTETIEATPLKEAQPITTTVAKVQTTATRNAFAAISQSIEEIVDDDDDDDKVLEIKETDEEEEVAIIETNSSKIVAEEVQQLVVEVKKLTDNPIIQECAVLKSAENVQKITITDTQLARQALLTNTPPPTCTSVTLLTPPTPTTPPKNPQFELGYIIDEDIFVRKEDGRLYLGTVIEINKSRQQYLVRFNDKSELWCSAELMRKPGGGSSISDGGNENSGGGEPGQMCVACKRTQRNDVVEICERCGRGYHRNCTSETSPDSGIWWCKRCCKPMKMMPNNKSTSVCRQLPYHADALKWDEKHRVNEEQFYCYCGKTGQFDNNMLQCCKCRNWFHTRCMQNFKGSLLRGDGFFVFGCTICNDGKEFLRRLQITWVDLLHLTLYNLSVMKKHHKYHHLMKDIFPFILERRHKLPVPKEWIQMSQMDLMKNITNVLKENLNRFVCGREGKRDLSYYALRNICPPLLPQITIHSDDILTDELLTHKFGLKIFTHSSSFSCISYKNTSELSKSITEQKQNIEDVYEFRIEDDEKFTSEDEIPIKHIMEKGKKCKETSYNEKCSAKSKAKKYITATTYEKIVLDDENANDANCGLIVASPKRNLQRSQHELKQSPKKELVSTQQKSSCDGNKQSVQLYYDQQIAIETKVAGSAATVSVTTEKSSRKRKAFTLSNSYKEIAAEAAAKRYDSSRICDSSSDENSSSSRGTSLDVIIPPPKNFLGLNNPFRMTTPKKSTTMVSATTVGGRQNLLYFGRSGTMIKNSIFNTTALDFSSKLAALKSAGIFPNLSTSNLAKAAGQPRTVRTIKRRLSAKDIMIGPNQEVRRRRTRRLSSNIEVISTTTINPIPSNFFPIHAKDLLTNVTTMTTTHTTTLKTQLQPQAPAQQQPAPPLQAPAAHPTVSSSSSTSSSPPASVTSSVDSGQLELLNKPTHGRRLRQRPQKISPSNSRRSSISSASTTSTNSSSNVTLATLQQQAQNNASNAAANATTNAVDPIMQDLKQTVKEYFGAVNRIESGDQFCIRAKRQLANGQMQYLIEWGDAATVTTTGATSGM